MKYISTRGAAPSLNFEEVTLAGLAGDGGLYVPEYWPEFSADEIRAMRGLPYAELALRIMHPFVGESLSEDELRQLCVRAYGSFSHAAVTPLRQLDHQQWVLELFHGPTLAFKDVALQMLGQLFDTFLKRRGRRLTIVGATSGDTGSAAIHAVSACEGVDIFMLHPKGRISEVQRRQMTSVIAPNVFNIAIDGSFDDAQAIVKRMFNDDAMTSRFHIGAVNSINWARLLAQIVYYFSAALQLGAPDKQAVFSVPTGNFGDVFAGYVAAKMGLPVKGLIVATNVNDILFRALTKGDYSASSVTPTTAPSMDIQVSSNFERLLFDLYGRDGTTIAAMMRDFDARKTLQLGASQIAHAQELFSACRVDSAEMESAMRWAYHHCGEVIDPHTAIGLHAALHYDAPKDIPIVTLATAHPAKFPEPVKEATGADAHLPSRIGDLLEREEACADLPGVYEAIADYVASHAHGQA